MCCGRCCGIGVCGWRGERSVSGWGAVPGGSPGFGAELSGGGEVVGVLEGEDGGFGFGVVAAGAFEVVAVGVHAELPGA